MYIRIYKEDTVKKTHKLNKLISDLHERAYNNLVLTISCLILKV